MPAKSSQPFGVFLELTDDVLLEETMRLAAKERRSTAQLIAALAEVDARRIYLQEGCSSTYKYCRDVLLLSEHAAYDRVRAARLVQKFPVILERLAEGTLTLSNLGVVGPFLNADNYQDLLAAIENKSKRDVETLVASLRPHLSSPEFYQLVLSVCRETWDQLHRLQELLRPSIGDGDPSRIVEKALAFLLAHVEKKKMAKVEHPRTPRPTSGRSRHVPAAVKREVHERDEGRCAFVGRRGRCTETRNLELHHRDPFGAGGPTTASNLELRCRAHNQYEAEIFYGHAVRRRTRPGASSSSEAPEPRAGP